MKKTVTITKEVDIKRLNVLAGVRYWEDAKVNGVDDGAGDLIPCRIGNTWQPVIDIDAGRILNWNDGDIAKIHYKVCDQCSCQILDSDGNIVAKTENDYVPKILSPGGAGYGDYIIMEVDANGFIKDWKPIFNEFEEIE